MLSLSHGGWVFLLVVLSGCGAVRPVVTLDMGAGRKVTWVARQDDRAVELDGVEVPLKGIALDARPSSRPQQAARELFQMGARSGAYRYEPRERRITPLGEGERLEVLESGDEGGLTREYLRWCERTKREGDCLRLLAETPILDGDGRYALAMALARGAVLTEMMDAFCTENVIRLDTQLHQKVSALFSTIRRDLTGSSLTVRQWLSTRPFSAQYEFGLQTIENVSKGLW